MQQIAIESMLRAQHEGLPVTVSVEARAERLARAKEERSGAATRVTMTAMLLKLLASALAEYPELNASIEGDEIVRYSDVNVGVAIALPGDRLSLAVLRKAQSQSLEEIADRLADVTDRARNGKLSREDVGGTTFTLSNIGAALPGAVGTPALPSGQCGVLLVTAPRPAPVVEGGCVVAGSLMPLSLTFDHRIVNGMPALRFLRAMRDRVEAPEAWF
jgi:pyruvate/2-oxoglutarate dehydrogenase complex dihydrolipoamide acyltransferase (E2) component